eukprot:TRINITY_DN46192_c0_g1_i1.p1 TRINITY_DN46192_c0_g1~~TRINITY_DN46192_c0_g1_i1.p1  ORF type:complete len:168 (+),score=28.70 TRINITY_DN46192_c0_g1_i1:143-646(+)
MLGGQSLRHVLSAFADAGSESGHSDAGTNHTSSGSYEFRDYYAAACPHCKTLTPAWDDAVKQYGSGNVKWKKIECLDDKWQPVAANKDVCSGVSSFPTLKLIGPNGEVVTEYDGPRTAQALVDFAKAKASVTQQCGPVALGIVGPPPLLPLSSKPGRSRRTSLGSFL